MLRYYEQSSNGRIVRMIRSPLAISFVNRSYRRCGLRRTTAVISYVRPAFVNSPQVQAFTSHWSNFLVFYQLRAIVFPQLEAIDSKLPDLEVFVFAVQIGRSWCLVQSSAKSFFVTNVHWVLFCIAQLGNPFPCGCVYSRESGSMKYHSRNIGKNGNC